MTRTLRLYDLLIFIAMLLIVVSPDVMLAQQGPGPHDGGPPCMYRGMPYGHFWAGRGRGPYGKRIPVVTSDEAKQVIESYFAGLGENVKTGKIEEGRRFFEVEILNQDGALIDKTIVDKRTGRIRSIY